MSFSTQNTGFGTGFQPNLGQMDSVLAGSELQPPWRTSQGTFGTGDGFTPSAYFPQQQNAAQQQYGQSPYGQDGRTQNAQQGPLQQMLSLFTNMLQSLMNAFGGSASANAQSGSPYGATQAQSAQTAVQNATVSSTGDPHLAVNGTTANGGTLAGTFDSMSAHRDLVDSDSFAGGYRVSTNTTPPNANGIDYNNNATVHSGDASVKVDNAGNVTIADGGTVSSLANGNATTLSTGATVTRNADGSVVVDQTNGRGGSIRTTLSQNGQGVDATTTAHDVDLGGDVVNSGSTSGAQPMSPLRLSRWEQARQQLA